MLNLSLLSKILEKVALRQLLKFLDLNNMRDVFQTAYRGLRSTETAWSRVFNTILRLDSGNVCLLSLLDLSVAFDTIDHDILLEG